MQIFGIQQINTTQALLLPEDVKHCLVVLRHTIGDTIVGVDGLGSAFRLQIQAIQKEKVTLNIIEELPNWEPIVQTHLVFSPLKQTDRLEWMLEKSIELGVTHWHPVICKRTEKLGFPIERMKRIAWAAIKQCKRSKIPDIFPLIPWKEALSYMSGDILIAHCEAKNIIQPQTPSLYAPEIWLCIGPEGDFSPEEVHLAIEKGCTEVSFGNIRMRSETAGIYFLALRHFVHQANLV